MRKAGVMPAFLLGLLPFLSGVFDRLYFCAITTRDGCIIPTFAADVVFERQESGDASCICSGNLKLTAEGVALGSRERKNT
jgi:hypothetical protein